MLDTLYKAFINYLDIHGFTISLDTLDIPSEALDEINEILREAEKKVYEYIQMMKEGKLERLPGRTLEQTLENHIMQILSEARDKAGEIAGRHLGLKNHVVIMARTGARANMLNITQMVGVLGQQAVRGERVKRGYLNRTLSYFKAGDLGSKAKGFVYNSFKKGLEPHEFFFHAIVGREGLVDTAVRTAQSGYMYRRLANALQDYYVTYDGSVRTSEGYLIQLKYGEDGIDPAKSDHGKSINVDRVIDKVLSRRRWKK